MIPRETSHPDISFTWYRQSGVFGYIDSENKPVTGISAQTWGDYVSYISDLPGDISGRVISPELITSTDMLLEEFTKFRREIGRRLILLCEISRDFPRVDFIVGTPDFSGGTQLPYNALARITNGHHKITERKRLLTPSECGNFQPAPTMHTPEQSSSTQSLICADMIVGSSHLHDNTRHVQASTCWAIPGFTNPYSSPPPDEQRYTSAMRYVVNKLFATSSVDDLVVVDRTPPTTDIPPLNCIVRRKI